MKLLFLNSLKGLKKKKIQMLGITLLVMLSTGIYVSMSSSLDRLEDSYYNYLEKQHVEHISVDYKIDYEKDITFGELENYRENELSNLTLDEEMIIDIYSLHLNPYVDKSSEYTSPFNDLAFTYMLDNIFNKYGISNKLKEKGFDSIKDKYDFDYSLESSKALKEDDTYIKLLPYDETKKVNKAYLVEGRFPTNDKEITILPKYGEVHNIKIGDNYKIGDTTYKVVGYTYAPDYIYPLVSYSALVFDEKTNNVIYINKEDYNNVVGVEEKTYSIYYHGNVKRKFEIDSMPMGDEKFPNNSVFKIFNEDKVTMNILSATRLGRISSLQLEFASDRLFAEYFLYLLLGIAVFVIAIVTKKRIEDEKLQIGVLKSLGYSPISIAVSYLVYPIIGSIIGGLLGFLIGSVTSTPLTGIYISYFIVPIDGSSVNIKYLIECLLIPTVLLSLLSYLIALFMLRKKPLYLLREGSNLKINIFSRLANKLTSVLPFKYRFKYSLAFRSIPKLIIVAITSFFTGMLIVLTLIGMNLFNDLIDKSFEGVKYDYMVYTNSIETIELDKTSDYVVSANLPLKKVKKKNGKTKKMEDVTLAIMGIDSDSKYTNIVDSEGNDLKEKLEDNNIIINRNMQNLYDLDIGDTLVLSFDEEGKNLFEYKVIGVSEEFINTTGYALRNSLCKDVGYDSNCYMVMLSKDKKYTNLSKLEDGLKDKIATVINFNDMKDNIKSSMDKYSASVYIVIVFAAVMAFVIISVIANIVVEENKKIISLMKVMGYENKKISSIVLNIYTPIIIISYLLSIPAMVELLKIIVSALSSDIKMTIPITLSNELALLGLAALLVAYYIAVGLSRRVLNKIPLAVALKRE